MGRNGTGERLQEAGRGYRGRAVFGMKLDTIRAQVIRVQTVFEVAPRIIRLWLRNVATSTSATGTLPVAVSMTSYGKRLKTAGLALESIAAGNARPERLILWVDDPDFSIEEFPMLRRLQMRGLEILWTENYGPHKKNYSYAKRFADDDYPLVTADDDIVYPQAWLSGLYSAYRREPHYLHCYRAHRIGFNTAGRIVPYNSWNPCLDDVPRFSNFATGVQGILFPPVILHRMRSAGDAFMQVCPKADDVWLNWIALDAGIKVQRHGDPKLNFMVIPRTQGDALHRWNVHQNANDSQIHAVYGASALQILANERNQAGQN